MLLVPRFMAHEQGFQVRADLADIGWKLLGLLALVLNGVLARLMAYGAGIVV